MVEHYDDGDPLGGQVEPMAAPAAQRAAMTGERTAELGAPVQAEAIDGRAAVGEAHRCGQPRIQRVCVVARCVDVALPGDHVVEAGAESGIAGP